MPPREVPVAFFLFLDQLVNEMVAIGLVISRGGSFFFVKMGNCLFFITTVVQHIRYCLGGMGTNSDGCGMIGKHQDSAIWTQPGLRSDLERALLSF